MNTSSFHDKEQDIELNNVVDEDYDDNIITLNSNSEYCDYNFHDAHKDKCNNCKCQKHLDLKSPLEDDILDSNGQVDPKLIGNKISELLVNNILEDIDIYQICVSSGLNKNYANELMFLAAERRTKQVGINITHFILYGDIHADTLFIKLDEKLYNN